MNACVTRLFIIDNMLSFESNEISLRDPRPSVRTHRQFRDNSSPKSRLDRGERNLSLFLPSLFVLFTRTRIHTRTHDSLSLSSRRKLRLLAHRKFQIHESKNNFGVKSSETRQRCPLSSKLPKRFVLKIHIYRYISSIYAGRALYTHTHMLYISTFTIHR